jgi:hypothetical protein
MDRLEKKNPLSEGILADSSEQGACGVAALPNRLGRYAVAHQRALQMADYALQQGEKKLYEKLTHCGHWLIFRHYYTVDTVRLHAADFCKKHLLCPLCAIRRGAKYLKAYMAKLQTVQAENPGLQAYMVTVTVKDGPDLWERFRHLRGAMKCMTQARRDHLKAPAKNRHVEFAKALGGVHSIEAKRGENSGQWHPHAHMVWLCHEAPDAAKLSAEWHGWTGDSYIVDVRPFHQADIASGFAEVFKYALKFSELPLQDNWDAFETLSNKRLVDSFGCLRGVEVSEDFADDELGDDLPYMELFYRFMHGGYSRAKAVLVDDPAPTPAKLPKAPAAAPVPGSKSYTPKDFALAAAAHAARVRSDAVRAAPVQCDSVPPPCT